jgi:hypothetical protein
MKVKKAGGNNQVKKARPAQQPVSRDGPSVLRPPRVARGAPARAGRERRFLLCPI